MQHCDWSSDVCSSDLAVLQNTKNKGDVAIGATVTDASAVLATDYKI